MPGFFDNETRQYVDVEWLRDGDWYVDADGQLYIVPALGSVAECEGPDNETMDALESIIRECGTLTPANEEKLGLSQIHRVFKRFSPEVGYYHA